MEASDSRAGDDSSLIPDAVELASFDPTAGPIDQPMRRWWGRHLAETRWMAELAALVADPVYRGDGVPRGHGEPVVLIPGFLAGDPSLAVMGEWLGRMGYRVDTSGITVNVDCSDRAVDRLDRRVGRIHEATGRRVTLIGHSRGGHFAKALAHRRPERVAGVIALGAGLDTPFDISIPTRATARRSERSEPA